MKKKVLAAILAMAMTAALATGCSTPGSKGNSDSGSSDDGGSGSGGKKRITYTLREDVPSMDPQNSNSIRASFANIHVLP